MRFISIKRSKIGKLTLHFINYDMSFLDQAEWHKNMNFHIYFLPKKIFR